MAAGWKPLANQPKFNASTMLLLTDGSVMCQDSGALAWWRLRPDAKGNYINGTWSALAPMHHTRLYYASAVLGDGRVFVAGGEYSDAGSETNTAEIYNPLNNTWTVIASPPGWVEIGDAPCAVVPDGRILIGQIGDKRTAIYDPATDTWSAGPQKLDPSSSSHSHGRRCGSGLSAASLTDHCGRSAPTGPFRSTHGDPSIAPRCAARDAPSSPASRRCRRSVSSSIRAA